MDNPNDPIFKRYSVTRDGLRLMVVGTYHEEDVGASCYHNHLSTLENLLTHLVDDRGVLVVDMVAGVDAFASTLHAQFDLMVLAVEPTWRSVEVYDQYKKLAEHAGCLDTLMVIGNKIRTDEDATFIQSRIPHERLLGCLKTSPYLERQDKNRGALQIDELEEENKEVFSRIAGALFTKPYAPQARLKTIWELHRRYVKQPSILERFGDLTSQIDEDFDIAA